MFLAGQDDTARPRLKTPKKKKGGAGEMVQWVKTLVTKLDTLSLIAGTAYLLTSAPAVV